MNTNVRVADSAALHNYHTAVDEKNKLHPEITAYLQLDSLAHEVCCEKNKQTLWQFITSLRYLIFCLFSSVYFTPSSIISTCKQFYPARSKLINYKYYSIKFYGHSSNLPLLIISAWWRYTNNIVTVKKTVYYTRA